MSVTLKRRSNGRSRVGCRICRQRHIKCDEQSPSCRNCLRAGRQCDGPTFRGPSNALLSFPTDCNSGTITERDTFSRFVQLIAPSIARFWYQDFWIRLVLPAAKDHNQVFNASLAITTLYDMPLGDTLDSTVVARSQYSRLQHKYQQAIDWYCKSVNASLGTSHTQTRSISDLALLLLTSILYLHVELRQGTRNNLHRLTLAAFAVIHETRAELDRCRDFTILVCLIILIDLPITTLIDGTCIPVSHRQTAFSLARKIAVELGAIQFYSLQIELLDMMYQLNFLMNEAEVDRVSQNAILELEARCEMWFAAYLEHKDSPPLPGQPKEMGMTRNYCFYLGMQARIAYLKNPSIAIDIGRSSYEQAVRMWERLIEAAPTPDARLLLPRYTFEQAFVPGSIGALWFSRDIDLFHRIEKVLRSFEIVGTEIEVVDRIIDFLREVVSKNHWSPTSLELRIFGHVSRPLRIWQVHLISYHLFKEVADCRKSVAG